MKYEPLICYLDKTEAEQPDRALAVLAQLVNRLLSANTKPFLGSDRVAYTEVLDFWASQLRQAAVELRALQRTAEAQARAQELDYEPLIYCIDEARAEQLGRALAILAQLANRLLGTSTRPFLSPHPIYTEALNFWAGQLQQAAAELWALQREAEEKQAKARE